MRHLLALSITLSLLVACGGGHHAAASAKVFKYRGSQQCTGGGASIAELQQQLSSAGIAVSASSCGTDGNLRAAVCGGPDGAIAIFEIPASQVERSSSLSFLPLSKLPAAREVPCR